MTVRMPEDLRTLILSTTDVSGVVGTRCHYNHTPQTATRPTIWFRVSSDTEMRTLDGSGGLREAFCDIECAATSEDTVQDLAEDVKEKLDGYKGDMGLHTVNAIFLRDKDDDYVPYTNNGDEGVHVVAFEAQLFYRPPVEADLESGGGSVLLEGGDLLIFG